MITLNILQLLSDNGFGDIALIGNEPDAVLFHEKLPLDNDGVYIVSRGAPLARGQRRTQAFDIYVRGEDDFAGAETAEEIMEFFRTQCYPSCTLPVVPSLSTKQYKKTTIVPTTNVQNVGQDGTDRVIYVVSAEVRYSN